MVNRPSREGYMMGLSIAASSRASCPRRQVGCILVNKRYHILATGYNGPPTGFTNCTEINCPGASLKSGEGLDKCQAIHAEQNALLQCKDVWDIHAAFVTTAPCITCVKLLLNSSCKTIYFLQDYPHSESEALWRAAGRDWVQLKSNIQDDLKMLLDTLGSALNVCKTS